jgi:hypothetical protein
MSSSISRELVCSATNARHHSGISRINEGIRSGTIKERFKTIHTTNLRLKQSTTLQQQQQAYPVTPEDGQLGRNT